MARKIATENPRREQWRLLSQFGYPENVKKFMDGRGVPPSSSDLPDFVAGCINQAESYFSAADKASLDISPLLLYYGATNLLLGSSALLTGSLTEIHHHGLKIRSSTAGPHRIADFVLRPCNPSDGALQLYCNNFAGGLAISELGEWTVAEVFGSVPDLRQDFRGCYENEPCFTVPLVTEVMETQYRNSDNSVQEVTVDRVVFSEVPDIAADGLIGMLGSIPEFSSAYVKPVPPQQGEEAVFLYRKRRAPEIGFYTIYGRKYLELPHQKSGKTISPGQILILIMGLFALGHVSRYSPQIWNTFVQSDTSGERLLVQRFLDVAERYIPNLILNEINGDPLEFFHPGNAANLPQMRIKF